MYSDISSDWQQCLWEPNYAVLPLAETAESSRLLSLLQSLGVVVESPEDKNLSMVRLMPAPSFVSHSHLCRGIL